jgi:hypothetical protein
VELLVLLLLEQLLGVHRLELLVELEQLVWSHALYALT